MEKGTVWAIVAITGAAFLSMHAGHIGAIVSGTGPAQQDPDTGSLSQPGSPQSVDTPGVASFTLEYRNGRYDPPEIRVKRGTYVRITVDPSTINECVRGVTIAGYGISKPIRAGDTVIEFTADRAGTFPISCTKGIGEGNLIIE